MALIFPLEGKRNLVRKVSRKQSRRHAQPVRPHEQKASRQPGKAIVATWMVRQQGSAI